jgi:photosystem II stability/assembly factor-like uncharacterized protein
MKTRFLLYLCISLASVDSVRSQWHSENCPSHENLNGIFLAGYNNRWIVGNNGTILQYFNGQWQLSNSPTTNHLYGVFMMNEMEGWAVGSKGTILHYRQGKWELTESPTDRCLYAVKFNDASNGIAIGELGTILVYTNNEWVLRPGPMRGNLFALSGHENEFWLGGILESVNIPILRMTTSADSKVLAQYDNPGPIHSLAIVDDKNGWAVGGRSTILHFDGNEWENNSPGFTFPALQSVYFENENHGICAGYDGILLSYRNQHWVKEVSGTKERLNDVFILNNVQYAVGNKGTIISSGKLQNDPLSFADGNACVYPNPGDTHVIVGLDVANDNTLITMSVSNLAGSMVKTEEILRNTGNYYYILSTLELKDGIYLLTIRQVDKTETKKLVIQHNR